MKKDYDFSKLKEVRNPDASKKKTLGINLIAAGGTSLMN
jgi:hypothetical protein